MPTHPYQRLLAAAVTGTLAIVSWTSYGGPAMVPTPRTTAPRMIGSFERPVHVRLQALAGHPSAVEGDDRDPFSARRRTAALVPPTPPALANERVVPLERASDPPAVSAPFKFMGILQKRTGETWGVFADCAGYARAVREGESVLGTWRVLRIGVESVFIESLNGQRLTMPMGGCGPRS